MVSALFAVLQGVRDFDKALEYIEKAIEGISRPLDEKYRSAFLRQKAKILFFLGDKKGALRTYEDAFKCCESHEFRIEIENEMKAI